MSKQRSSRGFFYFLTVTAPGNRQHVLPGGKACVCTPVGGVDLAEWNASHSARWNRLRTNLRRDHPGLEFMRGVEVQDRGALHDHAVMWSPTPLHVAEVKARAMSAGFGHEVLMPAIQPGSKKSAYYVSKYVTKATDVRESVPWAADVVDGSTGEVTRRRIAGRYRTWSCSRGWGLRMADVRAEAQEYAVRRAAAERDAAQAAALVVVAQVLGVVEPVADSGG